MTWRDDYRAASYRGVPFRVGASSQELGRRIVQHEYPARDLPYVEDLGRRARRFALEGWIVGGDYNAARDRLIEACEQEGPGELIHPYRGTLRVSCETVSARESTEEGGLVRLSFVFVESGEPASPVASPDGLGLASTAGAFLGSAAAGDLSGQWKTQGMPGFVVGAITDALKSVSKYIAGLQLDGPPGEVAKLLGASGSLADRVIDVAFEPAGSAGAISSSIRSIKNAFSSRLAALGALDRLADLAPPTFTGVSDLQSTAAANAQATLDFSKTVAVAESVELAAAIPWESLDQALGARDAIALRIDNLAGRAPDQTFAALGRLRAALGAAVPPPDQTLPRLAQHVPQRTLPSLVLAYELYGDRGRATELEQRNRLRRPGFVPGGQALEVLSA